MIKLFARTFVLAAAFAVTASGLPAQEMLPPNPFAGFHTLRLQNGMRVWYGYLPGSEMTSMAVVVPAGRDMDAQGREQTAHLLEHVLLSDRAGRTEAELVRELALRGGVHGGYTTPTTTVFPLTIPTVNAPWGVQWLSDVVAPRLFSEHDVTRNRNPVAVETGIRQHGAATSAALALLRSRALAPTPFWRREFGIDVPEERPTAREALYAITADDVQQFFDTWYSPVSMTLVVVSGLPPDALMPIINATFGDLPWRPAQRQPAAAPRTGESRRFVWTPAVGISTVSVRYRLPELDARDRLRLVFIEDLLRYRLMERLRRGDDKAVYSVNVSSVQRQGAGFIDITADVAPGLESDVRAAIDTEAARLLEAAPDPAFESDRELLARRVRVDNAATGALLRWAADRFAADSAFQHMPDLGEYYASVHRDSIAVLAGRLFVSENRILHVTRPLPVSVPVLAVLALIPVIAGVRVVRAFTLRPADMRRIRYVARIRPHLVTRFSGALLVIGALSAIALASLAAARWTHAVVLGPIDSFAVHALAAALGIALLSVLVISVLAAVPRKVLVFDDELRIKSASYRSHVVSRAIVQRVEFGDAPISHRLRARWLPATGAGVTVTLQDGSAVFLQVREPQHLLAALAVPSSTTLAPVEPPENVEAAWQHPEKTSSGFSSSWPA